MSHFIVQLSDGLFLYPRRATERYSGSGGRVGVRSMWGDDIGQVRVFTRKASATLAAKKALSVPPPPFKVQPVILAIAGSNLTGST